MGDPHAGRRPPLLMAMTPDGKWLVCGDKDGTVSVWNNAGRRPTLSRTIATRDGPILAVAVTPDGKEAICGSSGGTIQVLDIANGRPVHRLTAHAGGVRCVAVSRDGTRLASGGADKTVKIWDLASGACLHTLAGHDDQVNCVAFSSDAGLVVSGGADKKIIVWDAKTGKLLKTLEGSKGPVYAVCFAPALEAVKAAGSQPTGTLVAWIRKELGGALKVSLRFCRDVFTNESLYDIPVDETSKPLARDGWVISGGRDGAKDTEYSLVRIWDVKEGSLIQELKGHKGAITSIVYKPDLRVILSGSVDGSIRLWQPWAISKLAGDQSYKTFSGYTRDVTSMAVTDAGLKLMNASIDGTLHVWDMDQGVSLAKNGLRGILFSIVGFVLLYPIGSLVDRWNPIHISLVCKAIVLAFPLFFFFFYHTYTFALYVDLARWPFTTLESMAALPMMIMLYPKTKYGQMCSANALVRQVVAAIAAPLGAILMDSLTTKSLDTDYFRYGYVFQFIASSLSLLMFVGVYIYWKKLGGENYVAPEA